MTKQQILSFLKSYKHKDNETIKYSSLNNVLDKKTLSDPKNVISTAVKNRDTKFICDLFKNIYKVNGEVSYNISKHNYVILEKRGTNITSSKVGNLTVTKDKMTFSVDNSNRLNIEMPKVAEKNFEEIKKDIIKELQNSKIKSKDEFKKFIDNILATKF